MKWIEQIAMVLKRCFQDQFFRRAEILVRYAEANRYEMDRADSDGIKRCFQDQFLRRAKVLERYAEANRYEWMVQIAVD